MHNACNEQGVGRFIMNPDIELPQILGYESKWYVSQYDQVEIVEYLLNHKEVKNIEVNSTDVFGRTPLHIACQFAGKELVTFLLLNADKYGIDLEATDIGNASLLHFGALNLPEVLKTILRMTQIDLNAKDQHGYTAYHQAARFGMTKNCEILLKKGIDPNHKSYLGKTALHLACYENKAKTAKYMFWKSRKYGIELNTRDNNGKTALQNCKTYSLSLQLRRIKARLEN